MCSTGRDGVAQTVVTRVEQFPAVCGAKYLRCLSRLGHLKVCSGIFRGNSLFLIDLAALFRRKLAHVPAREDLQGPLLPVAGSPTVAQAAGRTGVGEGHTTGEAGSCWRRK